MQISGLSARTGVSIASLKYYLREGLLMPGAPTSATRAEYDEGHVALGCLESRARREPLEDQVDPAVAAGERDVAGTGDLTPDVALDGTAQ